MKTISHDALLAEQMQNPGFRHEYERLAPEFEVVEQLIALRRKRGMTQSQLAAKVGAPQSSIARLESRQFTRNLDFARRVAEALDARLEVRFVPNEQNAKRVAGHRQSRRTASGGRPVRRKNV
jgi:transcriptional regulator with XRE-family HTH domain